MGLRNHLRLIWTDAICINQNNDIEKNYQLPLMKAIYEGATNVIIWLGDALYPNLQIRPAFEQVVRGLQAAEPGRELPLDLETFIAFDLLMQPEVWATLGNMLCNDWFKRVWCLQEVVLAASPIVWYGNEMLGWSSLRDVSNELRIYGMSCWISLDRTGEEDALSAITAIDICQNAIRRNPVSRVLVQTLLDLTRRKGVTNPLDKIFGMLGLASKGLLEATEVDVKSSAADVYANFVKFVLQYDLTLSMLSYVASIDKMDGLPSWCPNFNSLTGVQSLGALQGGLGYYAGFSIEAVPDTHIIRVLGFSVDIVDKVVLRSFHWNTASKDCMVNNYIWERECLAMSQEVCHMSSGIPDIH
jgi:hypothetical protein